jgi:hypothetical protein
MKRALLVCLALAIVGSFVIAQDAATTAKHPWASFKEGSFVKMKTTMTMAGTDTVTEMTQTLTKLDTEFAYLKTEVAGTANETKLPLKGVAGEAKVVDSGSEDITVEGKIQDTTTEANGTTTVTSSWVCKDAPGGVVKTGTKTTGTMEMTSLTNLVKLSEKVKVGDKEVTCFVLETVSTTSYGKTTMKMWRSEEVPGFSVKMETKSEMSGTEMKSVMEVVEFAAK